MKCKAFAYLLAGAGILTGCSPKVIEKVRTEYVVQDVHHRDTIHTKDSVYIREWMKGDTVYLEKYKDRYVYRDRWRDSILVVRDSVAVESVKEVQVEKPLNAWTRFKIGAFFWLLAIAAVGWRKQIASIIGRISSAMKGH